MKTREVLRELWRGAAFSQRKAVFLGLVLVAGFLVFWAWRIFGHPMAAVEFNDIPSNTVINQRTMSVEVSKNGTVTIDGKKKNQALRFYDKYDEVRILVFDSTGEYISVFQGIIHLPSAVKSDEVRQIVYAVHGVGSTRIYMSDPQTLVYEANEISPSATLTLVADLPKGMIQPNFWQNLEFSVSNLPVKIWLYVAIVFPTIATVLMLFMILKRRRAQMIPIRGQLGGPPEAIAPALPGVLIDGVVGAREIAATLIDLARRGFIYIINKGNGQFSFGIRRGGDFTTMKGLSNFERELLSKIFLPRAIKSSVADVEMRIGRHIFSRKIAKFYLEIYNAATRQGFFVQNPAKVHLAWKYTGIALFFSSFAGFMLGAIYSADPKYGLFFWVGGMIAAALIIRLSPFMPARTARGNDELQEWLEFREYLTDKKPAKGVQAIQGKFEEYLPYSIVLGAEIDWAKRFGQERFQPPDWYTSSENVVTLDSFAKELFPLIGYVAENLARSHEPTVE